MCNLSSDFVLAELQVPMGVVSIVSLIKLFRIGPFTASYESSFITSLINLFYIGQIQVQMEVEIMTSLIK